MSGYDIKRKLQRITHMLGSCSNAQIYPVLKQLEQAGLVTPNIDKDSGKRQRKIYQITTTGKQYLLNWLEQPSTPSWTRDELMLKMSMGFNINHEKWQELLLQYQLQLDTDDQQLKQVTQHIEQDHKGRVDQKYLKLAHLYLQKIQSARHEWIEECLKELNIK